MKERKKTRRVMIGAVPVGGGAPVSVQSMTKVPTRDPRAVLEQIGDLHRAGCDIVRVAVPDGESAKALGLIVGKSPLPIVADIHFDHRLALASLEAGVHGLRINPGNIGNERKVAEVAAAARERGVPIRVGVNAGSLERSLLERYGEPTAEALVESALREISVLEKNGFYDIKVSVKSSSVSLTVEAYRLLAEKVDYPLHVGISEAGPPWTGTIRSAVGIGILLEEGIGDTVRVSLSGDPVEEVRVGRAILKVLGISSTGVDVVACPTCARTRLDVTAVAGELEERLAHVRAPLRVAVMGCSVNGPGEAREADVGVAGGKERAQLFVRGRRVAWIAKEEVVERVVRETQKLELEWREGEQA